MGWGTSEKDLVRLGGLAAVHQVEHLLVPLGALMRERGQDRKSTRLNSSHPSISYAVFCLKKKMSFIGSLLWLGEAADGTAVELDHLGEDAGQRKRCCRRFAAQLRVRPVQVGDEAFALGELGELAQVGSPGGLYGRDADGVAVLGYVLDEPQVVEHAVQRLGSADGAVAGDDTLGAELLHALARSEEHTSEL